MQPTENPQAIQVIGDTALIESAKQVLQSLEDKDAEILKWCDNVKVSNDDEKKRLEELDSNLKFARKRVKERLDALLKPKLDEIEAIRSTFKPHTDKLDAADAGIIKALSDWRKSQLAVTEETVIKRAEDYWEQRKEAEKTGEIIPLPDLNTALPAKISYHNMGSTGYRPKVIVRIVKPSLVPREFCMPVESLLRKAGELALARKEQMPVVEGAVIEVDYSPVARRSKG